MWSQKERQSWLARPRLPALDEAKVRRRHHPARHPGNSPKSWDANVPPLRTLYPAQSAGIWKWDRLFFPWLGNCVTMDGPTDTGPHWSSYDTLQTYNFFFKFKVKQSFPQTPHHNLSRIAYKKIYGKSIIFPKWCPHERIFEEEPTPAMSGAHRSS